jgi:hypothetical protein
MKSLTDEIITLLQEQSYPVTVKRIQEGYSNLKPVYPIVVIQEIDNRTQMAILGKEYHSRLEYQIDIYAKDMVISGEPTLAKTIVDWIGNVVDTALQTQYGFTRTVRTRIPEGEDKTVSRLTLRYSTLLDIQNDITYR